MKRLVKGYVLAAAALAVAGLAANASAGLLTGAGQGTITINADGSITVVDPTARYDGIEDVAYNVINNSSTALASLNLSGVGIFGFDGDGIDGYVRGGSFGGAGLAGASDDSTGYGGWNNGQFNSFSNIVGNTGKINFGGGGVNANGGTSFFSLEEPSSGGISGTITITSSVPLPSAAWMGMGMLAAIGVASGLRKRKQATIV